MWKSPNGTIRAILDGTVFRTPILVKGITPFIPSWKKPITIARHAYGDVYKNTEMVVPADCKAELVVTDANGVETRSLIHDFKTPGIIQGLHNLDKSISSFAELVSTLLSTKRKIFGLLLRILFLRNMTTVLRIFSTKYLRLNIRINSKRLVSNISIL